MPALNHPVEQVTASSATFSQDGPSIAIHEVPKMESTTLTIIDDDAALAVMINSHEKSFDRPENTPFVTTGEKDGKKVYATSANESRIVIDDILSYFMIRLAAEEVEHNTKEQVSES